MNDGVSCTNASRRMQTYSQDLPASMPSMRVAGLEPASPGVVGPADFRLSHASRVRHPCRSSTLHVDLVPTTLRLVVVVGLTHRRVGRSTLEHERLFAEDRADVLGQLGHFRTHGPVDVALEWDQLE